MSANEARSAPTDARPLVVIIVGPTAVGKTEVSLQIGEAFDAEIVSVDSRTFYKGMDIGTAKPGIRERERVPHHLIDVAEPDETVSLGDFRAQVHEIMDGIISRGRLPLLVGGSGQYIQAVRAGWSPPAVAANERLRSELARLAALHEAGWLHGRLAALDPAAAQSIDARNLRRNIRALEVIMVTGARFSDQRGRRDIPYRILMIGLRRSRPDLYSRIDARIDAMLQGGLIDETRRLLDKGFSPNLPAFSAIGYSQCAQVVRGEMDAREARSQMQHLTRAFVRRQSNWFKESDPGITWFDAARPDLLDAISSLIRHELDNSRVANA